MNTANLIISHRIFCQRSGLQIGTLELVATAGTLPYLTQWKEGVSHHPVFAMEHQKLLEFARAEWQRLAQRAADSEITEPESNILRVCYLAMLHSLDSVVQEQPCLPPLSVVQGTIEGLFNLSAWKFFLESKRFRFPTLKISKGNKNLDFSNISDYLDTCFQIKEDYETKVVEAVEKAKIEAAEKALASLRSEWVTPTSKKMLFQWVRAHLPEKYHADGQGWLGTLFLGNEKAIVEFEKEDVALFEEILYASCPVGNSIFKAVRERVDQVKTIWEQHHEAWEIDLGEDDWLDPSDKVLVNGAKKDAPDPGPEPQLNQFTTRGQYIQAHARWTIAKARFDKEKLSEF